ncbi:MAG TPA: type II toxin-antitoxin system CcdA family antitoxin [Luteibacter sp.]|jgi:antitoxin CcdA|uniref:type II toxin-antitoxin system CcdA family antitoxin n=1 Tax=Luteibacter sp. TaxID=1886636 RepID=UPI002F426D78
MAIAIYDLCAPKRALNLSLNVDLVAQARELTPNLSAQVEALLAAFVAEKKGVLEQNRRELQRAAEGWNTFVQEHGSFADEFSTL